MTVFAPQEVPAGNGMLPLGSRVAELDTVPALQVLLAGEIVPQTSGCTL